MFLVHDAIKLYQCLYLEMQKSSPLVKGFISIVRFLHTSSIKDYIPTKSTEPVKLTNPTVVFASMVIEVWRLSFGYVWFSLLSMYNQCPGIHQRPWSNWNFIPFWVSLYWHHRKRDWCGLRAGSNSLNNFLICNWTVERQRFQRTEKIHDDRLITINWVFHRIPIIILSAFKS